MDCAMASRANAATAAVKRRYCMIDRCDGAPFPGIVPTGVPTARQYKPCGLIREEEGETNVDKLNYKIKVFVRRRGER